MYIRDRSFGGKNYTPFYVRNQHKFGKNGLQMHHLNPILKKVTRPDPPPAALRADLATPPAVDLLDSPLLEINFAFTQ